MSDPKLNRKLKAIHQFHSGSAYGDAVTNSLLFMRSLLRELGFNSIIYVEHVAPALAHELEHFSNYVPSDDSAIFLHHSMGHDLDKWVQNLDGIIWLIYHNITPPHFFDKKSPFKHYAQKGLQQLQSFKPKIKAAIAVSPFNAQNLHDIGYDNVEIIPVLFDVNAFKKRPWNDALVQAQSQIPTIVFVGRIAPHKKQLELVRIAAFLKASINDPFQLILIGGYSDTEAYIAQIHEEIATHHLNGYVRLTGKISEEDLYAWYRAADVFVCMSEHEGFCVPIIEAMAFDVPVIALNNSNLEHTLGEGGILVRDNNPAAIAALIKLLLNNRPLRRNILMAQQKHIQSFDRSHILQQLANFLQKQEIEVPHMPQITKTTTQKHLHYQIEGPFETSYSLALVNREIALALNKYTPNQVGLFATEGLGDYVPNEHAIKQYPVETLWRQGRKESQADVVIRNLYPPRVADMNNTLNFLYFAWEESGLPVSWVTQFNRKLDGIPAPSHYVAKVLRDNGVVAPITVIGEGANHIAAVIRERFKGDLTQGFKFLHISSCFQRKGVDILLESYARAFTIEDPVTLIIKTFPNPHNTVEEQIAALHKHYPQCPSIVLINEDLPLGQIKDLYLQCDAFVAPTRGEGFGLPMAEAMWLGKPVITTAYGGQSDFCTQDTAWLIDFDFALANTHLGLGNSVWVEPKTKSLIEQLRAVYLAEKQNLLSKTQAAQQYIQDHFTWEHCAQKIITFENHIKNLSIYPTPTKKLAWISPWNTQCGIATYSSFLINELDPIDFDVTIFASKNDIPLTKDTPNVKRCWTDCFEKIDELIIALEKNKPDIIMIQYNFGFLPLTGLATLIEKFSTQHVPVFLTLHRTKDVASDTLTASLGTIRDALSKADRLLVHGINDMNQLKEWGLIENVTFIPHGIKKHISVDKYLARSSRNFDRDDVIIASYGFLLPHKGIEELLLAFPHIISKIPKARLLFVNAFYPHEASKEIYHRCMTLINASPWADRITMINDYLEDKEIMAWLACADLCVFAYQETAESASGAVRYGLSSHIPVACTPLPIFSDIEKVVHFLPGIKPEEIAQGIIHLLNDKPLLESKKELQSSWVDTHSWEKIAYRLSGMMKTAGSLLHE